LHLFYTPDLAGDLYSLNEEESRHCLKVLRLSKGDIIHLTDGKGNLFQATIIGYSGKHCQVNILENLSTVSGQRSAVSGQRLSFGKRDYRLHIAIAPTKNIDRFEWFLEKATEIGIDEITPLICEHSERRQLRTDRLEKVITSAMKQSLKAWHPKLNEAADFKKFVSGSVDQGKFMAFITDGVPMLDQVYQKGIDSSILIGPEGDFSPAEVEQAVQSGYQVVSLGDSRLRTETAGITACHTIYLLNTKHFP
jgi:16S rRNA (uracil1498-N3)-methyltransferase